MTDQFDHDVIIIGGGPAGSTVARYAAQGGADVRHPEWPAYWRLLDKLDPNWKT